MCRNKWFILLLEDVLHKSIFRNPKRERWTQIAETINMSQNQLMGPYDIFLTRNRTRCTLSTSRLLKESRRDRILLNCKKKLYK